MLALLVILPIAAFIAILLGAPARLTAIGASVLNLALGLFAAFSWPGSGLSLRPSLISPL
jgi:NADH-quinone oxidoreductase subunit M